MARTKWEEKKRMLQDVLDLELDETLRMLQAAVTEFAKDSIAPIANEIDQSNTFPRALWPKLGEMGLFGITAPEEYGGAGLGYVAHVLVMEAISRASASIALSYGAHSNLCVDQICRHGSEAQKKKWLPKLISGEFVGALAMSEASSGSDVMSLQCHATAKGDGYVIQGNKMWITNGPEADVVVVYAKTKLDGGSKGITAFIVEKTMAGFSTAQKLDKLGMRGSDTCELVFEQCHVPSENILGTVHEGTRVLMSGLNSERLVLSGGPLGIMQACLDIVLPYVHERKQFGKAIGEFQLIQAKVADMYTKWQSARAYTYQAARAADAGRLDNKTAASVILLAAENATQVALDAIQCLGGNGYVNEYPTGRLLRDAKLYEIGAGTSEIRRLIVGRELFRETT